MRIGYLGPAGSHSQAACDAFIQQYLKDETVSMIPLGSLTHILESVEEGALDFACVPVENTIEGSVSEVQDYLALKGEKTCIIAEFIRPVQHALIRKYPQTEGIRFVHSHPHAIGQCREALYKMLGKDIRIVMAASTSEAVKDLLTLDESHAALGTIEAAQLYDLEIAVENVNAGDASENQTLFLIISSQYNSQNFFKEGVLGKPLMKTSLCLGQIENRPGALLSILYTISEFKLNMSKIHSRPTKQCLGQYVFFIDIEGVLSDKAKAAIQKRASFFKYLGAYPSLGVLSSSKKSPKSRV